MAAGYNSFQIRSERDDINEIKNIADKLFQETDYKMQDEFLVWDNVEISGNTIGAEVYSGAGDDDCEKSRRLFEKLCKALVLDHSEESFMGRHSFDFANTDTTDYLLCFYRDELLLFYEAEIVDDVGCMSARRFSFRYENGSLIEQEDHEFDNLFFGADMETDNNFMEILESYDCEMYL